MKKVLIEFEVETELGNDAIERILAKLLEQVDPKKLEIRVYN